MLKMPREYIRNGKKYVTDEELWAVEPEPDDETPPSSMADAARRCPDISPDSRRDGRIVRKPIC